MLRARIKGANRELDVLCILHVLTKLQFKHGVPAEPANRDIYITSFFMRLRKLGTFRVDLGFSLLVPYGCCETAFTVKGKCNYD